MSIIDEKRAPAQLADQIQDSAHNASLNAPTVQLNTNVQQTEYLPPFQARAHVNTQMKLPTYEFGDSLLDDEEDDRLLQLQLPKVEEDPKRTFYALELDENEVQLINQLEERDRELWRQNTQ